MAAGARGFHRTKHFPFALPHHSLFAVSQHSPIALGPTLSMLSPHDRRSHGVLLGLVLIAKPNRHGEVVAAALRHKRSMQLDRHLSSERVPVAALADVEVLGQQAEVAGEGQAVAAAHELQAGDQVAGGFAALGLGVGALGLGIGKRQVAGGGRFHQSPERGGAARATTARADALERAWAQRRDACGSARSRACCAWKPRGQERETRCLEQAGSSQGAAWPNLGSPQDRRKKVLQTFVVVVVVVAEQVERGLSFEAHANAHAPSIATSPTPSASSSSPLLSTSQRKRLHLPAQGAGSGSGDRLSASTTTPLPKNKTRNQNQFKIPNPTPSHSSAAAQPAN
jgi:hypothetical protein